ncbi:hypothetical protein DQ244_04945 [Blastococcus sp. TBT05-19]|uniref:hypothetical protein n=1 Tax=Blastococcus sp. TBT05-19 TaxID=2250581 RepID=UPI000DE806EF|nr:hypothetical protein [Blastococcus sp. TBT05-19]RBY94637.1 hypothetical protein DQ244_04945 [Blastococcus sp. TBT05-19]
MLVLTPEPLQTAGERAFFGELSRWDTGASVRAAVVASVPLVDGPLGRRQSDAVLLVPEGIAVIRVVEVPRQSGVVTASPEGAWSIAAEGGPSQVLQLGGGGSSPLDGLMRAGMDTAMKLRRAGLEPGRIARLTVLVGEITGLVPADGDLGEGDHVATLEPRSLLLAIARASRHAGVDNPRLWTTADVRAALLALELPGRGPTVEELNGESFPYSPYVLRRPQLLTPAAMAASPLVADPAPEPAGGASGSAEPLSASAVARAVAASVASAHAAAVSAAAPPRPVPNLTGQRDTVAVDGPASPPNADAGVGGLFASAPAEPEQAGPPRTAVQPVVPRAEEPPPRPPLSPAWGAVPPDRPAPDDEPDGERRRWGLVIAAAVLALAVVCGVAVWLLTGGEPEDEAGGGTGPAPTTEAGPAPGDVLAAGSTRFTVEQVRVDETCAGHAYGDVAAFLDATDCVGLSRALYSASVEGAPVVVSVSRVTMADPATARQLRALADTNGSGNVSDLLREGLTFEGGPAKLSGAEYASATSGATVTIVESAWSDPARAGSAAAVDAVATEALALPVPPLPGD